MDRTYGRRFASDPQLYFFSGGGRTHNKLPGNTDNKISNDVILHFKTPNFNTRYQSNSGRDMNSSYSDLTVVSKFPCFLPRLFDLRCGKVRRKRGHRTKTCSKISYLSLKANVVSVVPKVDNILSSIHPSKPRPFPNL